MEEQLGQHIFFLCLSSSKFSSSFCWRTDFMIKIFKNVSLSLFRVHRVFAWFSPDSLQSLSCHLLFLPSFPPLLSSPSFVMHSKYVSLWMCMTGKSKRIMFVDRVRQPSCQSSLSLPLQLRILLPKSTNNTRFSIHKPMSCFEPLVPLYSS